MEAHLMDYTHHELPPTDTAFLATDECRALCHDFGLDPDRPLEEQPLPATEAREFWRQFDRLRHVCRFRTAADVAELAATRITEGGCNGPDAANGTADMLAVVAHKGPLVLLETFGGSLWLAIIAKSDPATASAALEAQDRARDDDDS